MVRGKKRELVFICIIFVLWSALFVPECDDCYFTYWSYDSLSSFLMTQPIREPGVIMAVPENGRYLGNVLGVLLGKMYFSPFWLLRTAFLAGGFLLLVWALSKQFRAGAVSRAEAMGLAFSIVVFAPRGIYQEVYSWCAAWVNYLLPVIGILFLARWMEGGASEEQHPGGRYWIAPVSFACCLFMEPVSIMLSAFAVLAAVLARKGVLDRKKTVWFCLGSWAGTAAMFLAPGYSGGTIEGRGVSLELMAENFPVIVVQTLQRPAVITAVLSALLLFLLYRQGCRLWKGFAVLLVPVHVLFLILYVRNLFAAGEQYSPLMVLLSFIPAVCWCVMLGLWRGGAAKYRCLGAVLALFLLNGPLLIVSPIGPRNFFPAYICLAMAAIPLYCEAREQGLPGLAGGRFAAGLLAVVLVGVYACNFRAFHQRLEYGQLQAQQGVQELELPLLPFPNWSINELPGKGDLSYLIYCEVPWDVKLSFVPYGEFGD